MIDEFLSKQYNAKNYNCMHFACDVWLALTGSSLTGNFEGMLSGELNSRKFTRSHRLGFIRLQSAESPCLVLFQQPRDVPHVGVFYNGRVLHLRQAGAIYQPLDMASLTFDTVRFYKCKAK